MDDARELGPPLSAQAVVPRAFQFAVDVFARKQKRTFATKSTPGARALLRRERERERERESRHLFGSLRQIDVRSMNSHGLSCVRSQRSDYDGVLTATQRNSTELYTGPNDGARPSSAFATRRADTTGAFWNPSRFRRDSNSGRISDVTTAHSTRACPWLFRTPLIVQIGPKDEPRDYRA